VLGEFPGCDEPGDEMLARDTLVALSRDFPGPVLFGLPSGHTPGPAVTLPLGVRGRVVAGRTPALVIEEAAVSEERT
jgi:muramoyltetrapeptide carboxypeptidase LdcA involved in peptidoglycan recycling